MKTLDIAIQAVNKISDLSPANKDIGENGFYKGNVEDRFFRYSLKHLTQNNHLSYIYTTLKN